MNLAIKTMLERYDCRDAGDVENALREVFQELALLGLWRAKFFEHAAFYGGTALRILYGLPRFSEDLDFSLLTPDPGFKWGAYCTSIERELNAWGFPVTVTEKTKDAGSAIESAFLKADTLTQMLLIETPKPLRTGIHGDQRLRIKLEVDTNPPPDFKTETKFLMQPFAFPVRVYAESSLFAGKMHAVLCRAWGRRVKGRDWYDLVWYVARNTPLDLHHLEQRMRQAGHWNSPEPMNEDIFRELLAKRIAAVDIDSAKKDAERFVSDPDSIVVWSQDFFRQIAKRITVQQAEQA
ncbi:MAG: nucleotidyl transferase AbiEii/AbiGii toxin family protein [Kiritimatiellales bacterium]